MRTSTDRCERILGWELSRWLTSVRGPGPAVAAVDVAAFTLGHPHADDIVCVEVSPRGDARCRQWQNAAIGQTDAERLVAGLAAPEDDRPLPM